MYYFEELDSTNNKAKEFETEDEQYIIYTNKQTSGRGQYDRKWVSENGLTFSIVLKKENENYASIVSAAIIKYLEKKGIEANIKYPNDIYYKEKKLCGILTENIYKDNSYYKTIIGIGININENERIINKVENSISIKLNEEKEKIISDIYECILEMI